MKTDNKFLTNLIRLVLSALLASAASQVVTAQWMPAGKLKYQVDALASNDAYVFAAANSYNNNTGKSVGMVFRSGNKGQSWELTNLKTDLVRALATNGSSLFAGTDEGVFLSTNNGQNWTKVSSGLPVWPDSPVWSVVVSGQNVVAGTQNNGIFVSSNKGQNWKQTNLKAACVISLAANGATVLAGTDNTGMWISTDGGVTWKDITKGIPDSLIFAVGFKGTNILAGSFDLGIYLSTNNGQVWTKVNDTPALRVFAPVSGSIFAGGNGGGPLASQTAGKSWAVTKVGMPPDVQVWAMTGQGTDVYAGTQNGSIYRIADVSPVTQSTGGTIDKGKDAAQKNTATASSSALSINIPGCTPVAGRPGEYKCASRVGLSACQDLLKKGKAKACSV